MHTQKKGGEEEREKVRERGRVREGGTVTEGGRERGRHREEE